MDMKSKDGPELKYIIIETKSDKPELEYILTEKDGVNFSEKSEGRDTSYTDGYVCDYRLYPAPYQPRPMIAVQQYPFT